ncbi:DUF2178 domain-containing protein [Candidatus Nanohalovita haloferacivicina]|uniref:DUF2178 domain-containing protein n=1 Tax=Candidatus Nanohalovita haloferacivicina TaxID=2978046 RepID=UPI00325FBF13|nr:hypothetical protein HBNXNv_0288 [Candidatus Nanohalobia archaeon BNXNv]
MDLEKYATKRTHKLTLLAGMIVSVGLFATEIYIGAAAAITATVGLLYLIKKKSKTPIEDERDISIAKDSIFKAFTWTGVFLGVAMIGISVALGTGNLETYPDQVAPYYLTWGAIMLFAITIEALKRLKEVAD